ncbi:MAG: arylsulfatase, partial [Verrucomicrobiota bacterium]
MKSVLQIIVVSLFCGFYLSAEERPNVIIVMTDDQGYGDLSCHGNPVLKTPHLDQFHAESVRFTDFHVSSFCTPTRAALMTGNHPGVTGAYRTSAGRTMLHESERTVADLFSENGYMTGMVGKWHLGDNAPHRPQDRGFQDAVWHRCGGIGQASDYWGNDYFDDTYERNGAFEKFEGYCTDVWFREAMRFVSDNQKKPFFLYLALNAPHGPYHVPDKWSAPYKGKAGVSNHKFYGMVANFDHNMGLLRGHLADLGLSENTILIFLTDNGTSGGAKFHGLDSEAISGFNAGMRGKKSSIYEGGHRVPFFVYWPKGGLNGGRDIDTIGAHIDVLPTLAELCGLPIPDESFDVDGLSLVPLLEGNQKSWQRMHHVIQYHGGAGNFHLPKPYDHAVVLTEKWRLLYNRAGEEELYDIISDPAQRMNIADDHPEIVSQLREAYSPFWKRVSAGLTPVPIDIGNFAENPTVLCSQDWRPDTGNPPWNFRSIRSLPKVSHPWLVNVKAAGKYKFTLRQFPKESGIAITGVKAKIQIAGQTLEAEVPAGAKGVDFELDLAAGEAELWTWIYDEKGASGGAYFTD